MIPLPVGALCSFTRRRGLGLDLGEGLDDRRALFLEGGGDFGEHFDDVGLLDQDLLDAAADDLVAAGDAGAGDVLRA